MTKKLFKIESEPSDLVPLAEALKQKPELTSLVDRLVNEDCTKDQLRLSQLVGRSYLEATFGQDSETVAKLVKPASPDERARNRNFFEGTGLDDLAMFIAGKAEIRLEGFDLDDDETVFRDDNSKSEIHCAIAEANRRESENDPTDMTVHNHHSGIVDLHEIFPLNFLPRPQRF